MGCCCGCLQWKKNKKSSSRSVLHEAKLMKKTKTNKMISRTVNTKIITKAEQQKLCIHFFELRIVFGDKYCDFTQILSNLYLTGIGGINEENISSKRIKCVVNVTYETPFYDIKGIISLRIPIEDCEEEDISIYFDELSNQLEKWMSHQMRVVVHCVCGISRSATLVLAYLMKYKRMRLKPAFLYVRDRRPFIRPNNAFFQQLIDYEKKLFKTNTVTMIRYKTSRGKWIRIPDIFVNMFIDETETEQDMEGTIDSAYSGTVTTRLDTTFF